MFVLVERSGSASSPVVQIRSRLYALVKLRSKLHLPFETYSNFVIIRAGNQNNSLFALRSTKRCSSMNYNHSYQSLSPVFFSLFLVSFIIAISTTFLDDRGLFLSSRGWIYIYIYISFPSISFSRFAELRRFWRHELLVDHRGVANRSKELARNGRPSRGTRTDCCSIQAHRQAFTFLSQNGIWPLDAQGCWAPWIIATFRSLARWETSTTLSTIS